MSRRQKPLTDKSINYMGHLSTYPLDGFSGPRLSSEEYEVMDAATDPPLDRFLYFPLPLPELDLEYTTDLDLSRNF